MTDVVDSTQLAQGLGDARMATLWSAHDRAARDLLRRWRGREIEKTDGLLALFDNDTDAARYALDYHRALAALEPPLAACGVRRPSPSAEYRDGCDDRSAG